MSLQLILGGSGTSNPQIVSDDRQAVGAVS